MFGADHSTIVLTAIRAIELAGVGIVVIGALLTGGLYLLRLARREDRLDAYHCFRSGLGRAILLGLEFLVAADIINTIIVELTLENILSLAGIVLIRTFLSWSLEMEIEGNWPWQRGSRRDGA